jgi:hypothetical protein
MTEPERIRNIEERIPLAWLLPGVNLEWISPEESVKLKRAVLDICRLSHARGFKSGADHAINAVADALQSQRDTLMERRLPSRTRNRWQDYIQSLRLLSATVVRKFGEE